MENENSTTLLLVALIGLLLVGVLYLLTRPKPQSNDLSMDQAGGLLVAVAEIYAGG
jgi:hypothetical protein